MDKIQVIVKTSKRGRLCFNVVCSQPSYDKKPISILQGAYKLHTTQTHTVTNLSNLILPVLTIHEQHCITTGITYDINHYIKWFQLSRLIIYYTCY